MKIQNNTISQQNQTNFQGKINIIPGDLSYYPTKYMKKAYNSINELIKDKPFDLFVKQDYKTDSIKMTAKKQKNFWDKKTPEITNTIANASNKNNNSELTSDLYIAVAKRTIKEYEDNFPQKTSGKINNFFKKLGQKFMQMMQDE